MSTANNLAAPAADLYQAWQTLRDQQPRLRAREAAAQLGVSEAELTASRLGIDAQRLRPDWAALLPALGEIRHLDRGVGAIVRLHHRHGYRDGLWHGENVQEARHVRLGHHVKLGRIRQYRRRRA